MGFRSDPDLAVLKDLAETIAARKGTDPASSYTASLLAKGVDKCAKKFGEEAVEVILAAASGDRDHTAAEAADVLYHLLVLLEAADVPLVQVMAALRAREGVSGHAEKAARAS
ncbi:MAG: phosphoribosyl-ATP diphosphatase [Pseudomonadota bacterium]